MKAPLIDSIARCAAVVRRKGRVRPGPQDAAASLLAALAVAALALYATPLAALGWTAWIAIGLAVLISVDDAVLPTLIVLFVLAYLATVGWGERHTFAADNLMMAAITLLVVNALRSIAAAVRAHLPRRSRRETNA